MLGEPVIGVCKTGQLCCGILERYRDVHTRVAGGLGNYMPTVFTCNNTVAYF